MRTLCILFSLLVFVAMGQRKFEQRELKGTFKEMRSGQNFAYEVLSMDIDGEARLFRIDPVYGHTVLKKLKPGTELTFKAQVDDKIRETLKNMKDPINWVSFFGETIDAVYLDGTWISTPYTKKPEDKVGINWAVLLEQTPASEIREAGIRKGLIFPNGFVAYSLFARIKFYSMEGIPIGKPVSFIGYESIVRPEYLYPIENVVRVVSFMELKKQTGKIESFIYKQNFARIGLTLNGERYSFPVEVAKKVERFAIDKPVTIYYHGDGDDKANLLPTIHAFVQSGDTLKIPRMYYGDPDGRHEHKPAQLEGKITQVNRSDRGHIISLILANDCYVEVDPRMATQLKDYLSKGKSIKISGLERIYRIITPQQVEVNGKEFILNK
jgi:hypothetical protein